MYFFTPRSKKYKEGQRPDRVVEDNGFQYGFWKATGREFPVMNNDAEIGLKRTLVYYKGKQGKPKQEKPNSKTNWIMQEFRIKKLTSSSVTLHNMDDLVLCKIYEHRYGTKKYQITDQNNKRLKVSTNMVVTPQCQPNQYHQTQCMQPSLSPNMVGNSQCHFNQNSDLAQKMQDDALFTRMIVRARYQPSQHSQSQGQSNQHSNQVQQMPTSLSRNMVVTPQDQPNQHSQSQAMKVSSSPYKIGISQGQSNQHSDQVQQMQVSSLSRNMVVAPQDQPNQHSQSQAMKIFSSPYRIGISQGQSNQHSDQVQQMQVSSLSRNMVVAPQDQPNQHSQSQAMKVSSSPYRIGITQGQPNQHSDQVQQMPASLQRNMVVAPQDLPNQHYAQAQQKQASLSSDMLAMPLQMQGYLLRSHFQMEDDSDACDFINFDSCFNNNFEYFPI
uniref:NAC family transcription factor n=1 Tax=Melilotus albus TaxID=47082 RepID=A0A896WEJ6_MELAB|nr:NAC family transcription factor [Melilotus albus]